MTTTPLPPNAEGATQCIVRWQVDTPAGWLGAYDKAAFEAYATQARADLEAENKRLREALEKLKHYAECQVAAFSNGRPFLDMTLFPRLCADARAALKRQP